LIVGAPGFATRRVPFEAGFMNVTLQPREPVALFLPPGIVAPQGASILVALAPQHGPAKDLDLLVPNKNYMRAAMISGLEGWGSFGMLVDRFEEGRASPWVTGGGAHRVLIGLSYPEGHDLHDFSRILEGGEVELPEEAPHQPLVIGLTQEALNAAEQRARELAAKLTR